MGKPKLLGFQKPTRNNASHDLRWERQQSRNVVKSHDSKWEAMFGGADTGCLKDAVTAGLKRKGGGR